MRRPIRTATLILIGLACGAGMILARDLIARGVVIDIPGAAIAAPGPTFQDNIATPERLIISKINVNAFIKPVGVNADGDMATPGNATDVGWYKLGTRPGMLGRAVIDGHLNTKLVPKAVFHDLDQLQQGDEIKLLAADGQLLTFKVIETKQYNENAKTDEIFYSNSNTPELVLITCSGDWIPERKIYSNRLIVIAERIS